MYGLNTDEVEMKNREIRKYALENLLAILKEGEVITLQNHEEYI